MTFFFERLLISLNELSTPQRRQAMKLVTVAWVFGNFWVSTVWPGTVTITRLGQELGANAYHFGLIAAMPFFAPVLSIFSSMWIDRSGDRKTIFLRWVLWHRYLWFAIAAVPVVLLWFDNSLFTRDVALLAVLSLILAQWLIHSVGSPAWISWMADLVPDRLRGRYFARRRQWGILSGIAAALIAGWALQYLAPRDGSFDDGADFRAVLVCGALIGVAAIAGVLDIWLFRYVPHVPPIRQVKPKLWDTVGAALRNRNFMAFTLYLGVMHFTVAPLGQFFMLFLDESLRVSDLNKQLMLQVAPMLAQLSVLFLLGRMVDRVGRKPMFAIASVGLVPVGVGWCFMLYGHLWLGFVLAALGAILWAGIEVANLSLVMQMSSTASEDGKPAGGSGYWAVNVVVFSLSGFAGGLSAGWFVETLKTAQVSVWWLPTPRPFGVYELLFLALVLIRFAAIVVMLPFLKEPEAAPTGRALRVIAAEMYAGVLRGISLPRRVIGSRLRLREGD
jgi:MFS family permease